MNPMTFPVPAPKLSRDERRQVALKQILDRPELAT